jgi:ComF family protein
MVNEPRLASFGHAFRRLREVFSDWLLPPICVLCGAPGRAVGEDLCAECEADLPLAEASAAAGSADLDATWSAFRYEFPVAEMLREVKFHGRVSFARVLGAAAARRLTDESQVWSGEANSGAAIAAHCECLLPVPLHIARLRQRGFNQSLEIAKPISRAIGLQIRSNLVRRPVATREQSVLPRAQRQVNLKGAFSVAGDVAGLSIAIVDDVLTTGATVQELAHTLKQAGAARVIALTVARTGREAAQRNK